MMVMKAGAPQKNINSTLKGDRAKAMHLDQANQAQSVSMESEFAEKAATAAAAAATKDENIQLKKYATMTKIRQS